MVFPVSYPQGEPVPMEYQLCVCVCVCVCVCGCVCVCHRYVFRRMKWAGSKTISHLVTLLLISLWHGVWPGYYVNFSFEFIAIIAERSVSHERAHLCGACSSHGSLGLQCCIFFYFYFLRKLVSCAFVLNSGAQEITCSVLYSDC